MWHIYLVERVAFFKGAAKAAEGPLSLDAIHGLIQGYAARSQRAHLFLRVPAHQWTDI